MVFFFSFLLLTPPEGTSPKFFPRVITKISGVIYCHAKGTVDMLLPSARAERASANPSLSSSLFPWRDRAEMEGSATGGDGGMQKAAVQVAEGWEEVWMQV